MSDKELFGYLQGIMNEIRYITEALKEIRNEIASRPGLVPTVKKLPKGTPKIESGKVYKIANKPCNTCGGLISWDLRPERVFPLHVNEDGTIKGTGDCPEYDQ